MHNDTQSLGNTPLHLRKEGDCYKDLSNLEPLKLADERIRPSYGSLIAYETLIAQLYSQRMTIEERLHALILLNSLPPSCETLVTTICNASTTAMTYASATNSILFEDVQCKSFEQNSSCEAYVILDTSDRHHHR